MILCALAPAACGPVAIGVAVSGGGGGGSAPAATILELTDRPPPCTNQTTATFRYAVSPNDTPCRYRIDGGDFVTVQGGQFTVTVPDGEHTIELTQVRDPNVRVEYRWTVDTVAPTAPTGLAASAERAKTLGLTWVPAVDQNCGVGNHIVTYRLLDAGSSVDIDVPTDSAEARFDLGGLPDTRTVSVRVAAVDRAGNVGPPSAAITARVRSGGDGTLGAAAPFGVAVPGAGFLLAADFDGDEIPDLAVCQPAQNGGQVTILRGTGANGRPDGGFAIVGSPYAVPGAAMLASGDFNADRRPDLAVVGSAPGSEVRILLGGAGGTFTAGQSLAQPGARCLAVADADVDGIRDLLVGSASPGIRKVTVLRGLGGNGRGTGAFAASGFEVALASTPERVVARDLNSDYSIDLAIACSGGADGLLVAQGLGDGTFMGAVVVSGVAPARDLAVADFDGDFHADVAVLRADGSGVSVVANTAFGGCATGVFGAPTLVSTTGSPTLASLLTGDFDSDGRTDLALLGRVGAPADNDGRVFIALQQTAGLGPAGAGFACGADVAFGAAADFDGNGALDVVVSAATASAPLLLRGRGGLGRGDGTFELIGDAIDTDTGRQQFMLVAADFNRDGIVDLAACNQFAPPDPSYPQCVDCEDVVVLLGQGSRGVGTGTFGPRALYKVGRTPQDIAAADLNNDGILDLVTANTDTGDVSVLLGVGDGTFRPAATPALSFGSTPRSLVVGAFRHPGVRDLCAVSFQPGNNVRLFFGATASCGPEPTLTPQSVFAAGPNLLNLAVADFDNDQVLDLALCSNTNDLVQVRLGPSVASGRGSGNFASATPVAVPTGDEPEFVVAQDFTGDGVADLLVANRGNGTAGGVVLCRGLGNGQFASAATILSGGAFPAPNSLACGDFNADGILDVVVGSRTGLGQQQLQILVGNGANGVANGTFAAGPGGTAGAGRYQTPGTGIYSIVTADFDSDGVLDIAYTEVIQNNGGRIRLLKGRGVYQ